MSKAITVRVDEKGRLTIPARERKEWGVEPGAVFFIERKGDILQLARAENPLDGLARHALAEHEAGRTKRLREFAREQGITLDGE
jgi:bifunctional DNA-binding transcriptional regulator/antitoxin component of YhaV-PrlF toxin-antitoxin module